MRNEHFELHRILKEKIKGKIFIGEKNGETTININGFKGTTWQLTINDTDSVEEIANTVERKYRNFVLNRFFIRRLNSENNRWN